MSNLPGNESSEKLLDRSDSLDSESAIVKPRSFIENGIKLYTVQLAQAIAQYHWITPNRISVVSALLGGPLAGWSILERHYFLAVGAIVMSGVFDDLDGDLARERGVASREGAILDSILDRYVDFFILAALICLSPSQYIIPGLFAMFGAMMVPYIRARTEAEGKNVVAAAIGNRTTRIILIIIGLLTQQIWPLLIILAVTSNIAALQRFIFALQPQVEVGDRPRAVVDGSIKH